MADGPDIFGIDKPKENDPWADLQAQQARLGRNADPTPAPTPPGVDIDSMGRAWADVPVVDTAGSIKKTRRQLTPEEVAQRSAPVQTFEELAQEQQAAADPAGAEFRAAASAQQANELAEKFGVS